MAAWERHVKLCILKNLLDGKEAIHPLTLDIRRIYIQKAKSTRHQLLCLVRINSNQHRYDMLTFFSFKDKIYTNSVKHNQDFYCGQQLCYCLTALAISRITRVYGFEILFHPSPMNHLIFLPHSFLCLLNTTWKYHTQRISFSVMDD